MDNLGLNEFLQPVNSPITQNIGAVSSYDFSDSYERSVIGRSQIKNLAVGSAQVGTAVISDVNIADGAIVTRTIAGSAVTNAKILDINASKITAGTVVVALNLGTSASGSLILDGANNRILVHDGTTNRIVIGNV
jgi:hypothetical protein